MRKIRYTFSVMVLTVMVLGSALAQSTNDVVVPLSNPSARGRLKAHLNFGSISVKGTARKDVLVKYVIENDEKENRRSKEDVKKTGMRRIGGGGVDLEIVENENVVSVNSDSWSTKLKLEIEVPSGFDMHVSAYNDGDLVLSNIQGELELTNYNGEITALNISGSVVANTYNGGVKVTFDNVKDNAPMSYSTYNGDIDITFPTVTKASLKMKTEQGEIFTDFDIAIKSSGPVQKKDTKPGVYKVTIDEWKRGDLNGGGAEVTMKNYNGDIYIRKK